MKAKASLKSAKRKLRAIASRPSTLVQSPSAASARTRSLPSSFFTMASSIATQRATVAETRRVDCDRYANPLGAGIAPVYGARMSRTYRPHPTPTFTMAPSLEDVEAVAAEAMAMIPEGFRRHVGNVHVHVEDF